jgi:hypothetical protein
MLGLPLRYWLKHPLAAVLDVTSNPAEIARTVRDWHAFEREQRRPLFDYEQNNDWELWMHRHLRAEWPCNLHAEFWGLWVGIMDELRAKGIQPGPESYDGWNDGDAGLVRAAWCLTRHLRPLNVVETGVAHGVTSRFVLEALERNGSGHLWSIDLPPPARNWRKQIGIAVGKRQTHRWSYIQGSSRGQLPALLARLGRVDLFIHDSLHTERNVRFELDRIWDCLKRPGAIVVDDVDGNWGFQSFRAANSGLRSAVCEAEPLHPDPRRFNRKGQFGVILTDEGVKTNSGADEIVASRPPASVAS